MFRSVLLALGVFVLLFGIQCLCVQTFVFTFQDPHALTAGESDGNTPDAPAPEQEPFTFTPSRTVAWSLVAVGGFLVLNVVTGGGRRGG